MVSATGHQMALRTMPGATRLVARQCTFRSLGGDTVSPWDADAGQYYFQDCTMEGGSGFLLPPRLGLRRKLPLRVPQH